MCKFCLVGQTGGVFVNTNHQAMNTSGRMDI